MKLLLTTLLATLTTLACLIRSEAADGAVSPPGTEPSDTTASQERVIVDFNKETDLSGWEVQDDVVMGGKSQGAFALNEEGHAVFSGNVSLEDNGGFSSVQHYLDPLDVSTYRTAVLRVKGDGNRYKFLVEANRSDRHYYEREFQTGTEWQTVEIPLAELYPVHRGDRLDLPHFPGATLSQVRIMIANGRQESFRLEIDKISLK